MQKLSFKNIQAKRYSVIQNLVAVNIINCRIQQCVRGPTTGQVNLYFAGYVSCIERKNSAADLFLRCQHSIDTLHRVFRSSFIMRMKRQLFRHKYIMQVECLSSRFVGSFGVIRKSGCASLTTSFVTLLTFFVCPRALQAPIAAS